MKRARWAHLLDEEPDFRRWYENLARGSELTAKESAKSLYRFLRMHEDLSPKGFVELALKDQKAVENILMDFVGKLHMEGKSSNYIANYLKAIRSWLNFNDITLVRKIKIGDRNRTPTIEDERVPTQDELASVFRSSKPRGMCSIALMAFSGVRPGVLASYNGDDGLEIRDLPELAIENGKVTFPKVPTMVMVRAELSKTGVKYFSFLSTEGCDYMKDYLERRMAQGEVLEPQTAIIAVKRGFEETGYRGIRGSRHVTTKSVTKEIREAMRPRFQWRPYVLRAYFDTQLLIAESQGKITHAYRQFFMGHKGDIEARYTTNKGRLPESIIEDMREAYQRSQKFLQTTKKGEAEEETMRASFRKQLLLVAGFSVEDVEELDPSMDDETFQETVRKKLLGSMANNGANQKVINVRDVEHFLSGGWDFVAMLPDDRVVVRLPH
ncbi:site-specific integrase [Candidatus Bathyarchaeota archaeon]|nr:site-specific integrase [Candidatus Bathyarchaeota archaeon]